MVFAVGLVAAYSSGWIVLYGTLWIMMLAYLTKNLPYAFMSCNAALAAVHVDLENAARVLGASALRALRDITAPLVRNGLLSGWIVVFANSLRDLSASVLLYTSATTVISTAIMDVYYASAWGAVAALSVILLGINAIAITVGYRIFGRNVLSPNA
jgi:iron(III) transport system permease protein